MFAESRESVVPRVRHAISGQKIMIAIFFTSAPFLVLEAVPKGMKFNQDYFIEAVLLGLSTEKRRVSRGKCISVFSVYMDN
jgi:ABC-type sulfate transport system permease component